MDGQEIRQKIDDINFQIKEILNKFVLTEEIKKLAREKGALQAICSHEFKDGFCIYCDVSEDEIK